MIRLLKMMLTLAICLSAILISAQSTINQDVYAHNDTFNEKGLNPSPSSVNINSITNHSILNQMVSQAFLNPSKGFIGIIFTENMKSPNIYYKIVDQAGREVYNGSAHAAAGSQPTLYYNTKNLPSGQYRVFIENDDFFMSTSFMK